MTHRTSNASFVTRHEEESQDGAAVEEEKEGRGDEAAMESDEEPVPPLRPMIGSTSLTCSSKFLTPKDTHRGGVASSSRYSDGMCVH